MPVNFDRIGTGKVEDIPGIIDRGSEGKPAGMGHLEWLKQRDGIQPPNSKEPLSDRDNKEQEIAIKQEEPEKEKE